MIPPTRISLEQWRALIAVVDAGGYARAAETLNKSQSTVTYAVKKLETVLDVRAFEIKGRKAALTATGALLYRRGKSLLEDADRLERAAKCVSAGWEAQIAVSADVIFPVWLLLECLDRFGQDSPHTNIELIESVMGGSQEDLLTGRADIAISNLIPPGFLGEALLTLRFVPVAHPNHPLHALDRELSMRDLRRHRHLVVRESGSRRGSASSLASEQRWTMSNIPTSIGAACRGYGFAWYPEDKIRDELADGVLKPLPLARGRERFATVYQIVADPETAGPGVSRLTQIIRDAAATLAGDSKPQPDG